MEGRKSSAEGATARVTRRRGEWGLRGVSSSTIEERSGEEALSPL